MRIIENWIKFTYKKREWKRNKHCNSFIDNQAVTKKKTSRHKVNIKRNVEQKCYEWKKGMKISEVVIFCNKIMCEPKIFPMRCFTSGSRSFQLCSNHISNHKWIVRTGKNTHIYFIGWILLLSLSRSVCDYSIFDGYGASIAWYRPLFQLRFLSTFFLLIFFYILHIRRKKEKRTEDALKPASRSN